MAEKESVQLIEIYGSGCVGWIRHDEPFWRVLERKPQLAEKFKDLKSDDLAKIAPWAIFGTQAKH